MYIENFFGTITVFYRCGRKDSSHTLVDEVCNFLLYLVCRGVNDEPKQPGNELFPRPPRSVLRVHHEEHVREAGPEESSVELMVPRGLGNVDVPTFWAVELHHLLAGLVIQTDGQDGLFVTEDPGTATKVPSLVLLNHLRLASGRHDVSATAETFNI